MKKLALLTIACVLTIIPAASASFSGSSETPIVIKLLTDKESYNPGEEVKIELQAINTTDRDIDLAFGSSHQQDYCIDGKYLWSSDKYFTLAFTSVHIPAGGTYSWTFVHTAGDYYLSPGTHVIVGTVVGHGHSNPVAIVVAERSGLVVTVSTDRESYSVGEEIPIHVTITNKGESDTILIFRSGRQAGYCIDGRYFRYDGSDALDVYTEIPLPRGASHTWHFSHGPNDYPLAPGEHTIVGIVAGYGHSQPIAIKVTSGLLVTVETDQDEYALDQDVIISVTATNKSPEPITLRFNSSHQATYIIDGAYDWSKEHPALMIAGEIVLGVGESKTWEFTHKPDDYRLLPGKHSIVGVVIGYGKSQPTEIFVLQGEPVVEVSVSTDKETYELGEPVKIEVIATNNSDKPVTLRFPTLHQADYHIDEAYLWSKGKFFLPISISITIPPGAQISWGFVHCPREYRLLPGEHSIVGIVVGYGRSAPRTIVVKEKVPAEVTAQGLLAYLVPNVFVDMGGEPRGYYMLYTRDPEKVYVLFPGAIDLAPHVNMTVEVTGHYVYTLIPLPVPGIPLGVETIRDILSVEVETDKSEYYQQEDINITVIARNLTENETLGIYLHSISEIMARIDDIVVPPAEPRLDFSLIPHLIVEIPHGETAEWKFIYSGKLRPLSPGEHLVTGEIVGYGMSGKLPINIIEKPSEKILASGIVSELPYHALTNGVDILPEYVLVDRETGNALYVLRNPAIDFGWYLRQFVEVVGVPCELINSGTVASETDETIPELFVLRIRRLLAIAVSTDRVIYPVAAEGVELAPIRVFVTAKNCTPERLTLEFPSVQQAYSQISSVNGDMRPLEQVADGESQVIIEPYDVHVWEFKHDYKELPEGDHTVLGGVYGYGQGKPVAISIAKEAPEIVTANGVIEKFWWWKWFGSALNVEGESEIWPWPYPCRYVLFNLDENKVIYFLSSDRVELDWYVGMRVQVTGYPVVDAIPLDKLPGVDPGEGIGPPFPVPPIIPPWPPERLNVVSVVPTDDGSGTDQDGDGIRDTWEIITGLKDIGAGNDEDSNGDGMPNLWEYICGTDPLDAASVIKPKVETNSAGMVVLRWNTVPGKTYSVYCADGWSAGEPLWRLLIQGIEGTGAEFTWTDDGAADVPPSNAAGLKCRFYRVEVK